MESKKENIFIHAISQRCGHNFLSLLIKSISDYEVIIHDNHEVIIPEFLACKYKQLESSKAFIRNKKAKLKEIKIAANKYSEQSTNIIFKSSRLTSSFEIDLFPNLKHLVLVRDPKDLFVSYEKSLYNFRVFTLKNRIKSLIRPLYSFYVLSRWRKNIIHSLNVIESIKTPFLFVKYEDLQKLEGQKNLFQFLNLNFDSKDALKVKNFNSSFASSKDRWTSHSKWVGNTNNRYENAPFWLKLMIKTKLGGICKRLNYN